MKWMRLLLAALALALVSAQPDPSPDSLLAAIRQNVRQNLTRLPDYTCRLTIERSTGRERARRLQRVDTVHIEVGYLDGKELYAWPGQKFESVKLEEMMPAGGAIGTGDFALHVKAIFLTNEATFTYAGRAVQEGRDVIQFQYRVPRARSQYYMRGGPGRESIVGYHGSFWADAQTLRLMRLEITIDEIPPEIHVRRAGSTLTYAMMRIGEADFLLPHGSDLFIVSDNGRESRNRTRFEQCRQYLGESVVSFAEPAITAAEPPKPVTEVHLPAGVRVELILRTALDGTHAAIGDPVTATVFKDAVKAGAVVIPKGAKVTGRITHIGQTMRVRTLYQVIGFRLSTVEFANCRAEFTGALESLAFAAAQTAVGSEAPSGQSIIFMKGNLLHIPAGAHMFWRTANGE